MGLRIRAGTGGGRPGAWLRPYRWLALFPGYDGLRVPARFAMLATLCLSIAAGLAVARLQVIWRRGFGALAALVLGGVVLDGLMQRFRSTRRHRVSSSPVRRTPPCSSSRLTTRVSTSRQCIGQWSTAGRC